MKRLYTKNDLRAIALLYGANLKFDSRLSSAGTCDYRRGTIYMKYSDSNAYNLSVLFHEIGHIHCYRNGLWKGYHHAKPYFSLTREDKVRARVEGFRAECWVERWAEEEMKELFPKYKYRRYYGDEYSRQWLHNNFLNIWYKI